MGAIAIAFVASVFAGIGAGLVVVTRRAARGVRPRAFIREHCEPFDAVAVFVTAFAVILGAAAVIGADALRLSLGVSCAAAAVLFGAATWLLAVEPDDDADVDSSPEPSWWPEFERDLEEWARARRTPRTPTLSRH